MKHFFITTLLVRAEVFTYWACPLVMHCLALKNFLNGSQHLGFCPQIRSMVKLQLHPWYLVNKSSQNQIVEDGPQQWKLNPNRFLLPTPPTRSCSYQCFLFELISLSGRQWKVLESLTMLLGQEQ